jgi:hypothetical protein
MAVIECTHGWHKRDGCRPGAQVLNGTAQMLRRQARRDSRRRSFNDIARVHPCAPAAPLQCFIMKAHVEQFNRAHPHFS